MKRTLCACLVLLLMLPLGFNLALLSSLSEGHRGIRALLKNQQTVKDTDASSPD